MKEREQTPCEKGETPWCGQIFPSDAPTPQAPWDRLLLGGKEVRYCSGFCRFEREPRPSKGPYVVDETPTPCKKGEAPLCGSPPGPGRPIWWCSARCAYGERPPLVERWIARDCDVAEGEQTFCDRGIAPWCGKKYDQMRRPERIEALQSTFVLEGDGSIMSSPLYCSRRCFNEERLPLTERGPQCVMGGCWDSAWPGTRLCRGHGGNIVAEKPRPDTPIYEPPTLTRVEPSCYHPRVGKDGGWCSFCGTVVAVQASTRSLCSWAAVTNCRNPTAPGESRCSAHLDAGAREARRHTEMVHPGKPEWHREPHDFQRAADLNHASGVDAPACRWRGKP